VKWRIFTCLLILSLALGSSAQSAHMASSGWEIVGDGIEYREFRLPGPNRAFVARMDRNNPNVILESSIAQGTLAQGKETVSGMASRYDQAINAWDGNWGSRNQVVVAINGSFYNPETGIPQPGLIHSGWYVKRFGDYGGGSGFAWKLDRSAFIGGCVYHQSARQVLTNLYTGNTQRINDINGSRKEHETVVYTPQYDRDSHQDNSGVEVLVELIQPLGILPLPDMDLGIVREIRDGQGSIPIPFDHIVLSAHGRSRIALLDNYKVGDVVGISLEITHLENSCETPNPIDWTSTYASIGGSFVFLKDGVIQSFDDLGAIQRHPRTAICFNNAFIYFIVVDGRNDQYSIGMTITDLGTFCKDTLGATWGINQDGGGSSTMWVNGEVKNSPSDGQERWVANGMMMVVVEPMERSTTFWSGDQVEALYAINLHLGPGTNYAAISSVAENAEGVILPHLNYLNGVLAKGTHWWKVDFAGVVGWVDEDALALESELSPVSAFHQWTTSPTVEATSDLSTALPLGNK